MSKVEIDVQPGVVKVKGPKGELSQDLNQDMKVAVDGGTLTAMAQRLDKATEGMLVRPLEVEVEPTRLAEQAS